MKINAEHASAYVLHCENLCKLAGIEPNFWEGHKLYQKLRRLELKAHRLAEQFCNGDIDETIFNKRSAAMDKVKKLLPKLLDNGTFICNADPRGYALKFYISGKHVLYSKQMDFYRDMGGYGILAPEF